MEINALTLYLVQSLQNNQTLTGQQIIEGLAKQLNLAPESLVTASDSLFQTFAQADILLGVQKEISL